MGVLDSKILEARGIYWSIALYETVLDFIIGFMASAILFQILGLGLLYALLPAFLYALFRVWLEYKRSNIIKKLEGKYDNIDERLKTAVEYKGARNIIAEDLIADVAKRMDNVETSTFLESKELSRRVYSLVLLSFILLTVTVLNLHSLTFNSINFLLDAANLNGGTKQSGEGGTGFDLMMGNRWEQSNWTAQDKEKLGAQSGGERPGVSQGPLPGTGSGSGAEANKDIYGKASSASIEGKDVDFRLHPEYGGDIEIRETGGNDIEKKFKIDEVSSVEECVECVVGPENEEMVRRYFEKILPES